MTHSWGGGQRPFGNFPKIHPFWLKEASLSLVNLVNLVCKTSETSNILCLSRIAKIVIIMMIVMIGNDSNPKG